MRVGRQSCPWTLLQGTTKTNQGQGVVALFSRTNCVWKSKSFTDFSTCHMLLAHIQVSFVTDLESVFFRGLQNDDFPLGFHLKPIEREFAEKETNLYVGYCGLEGERIGTRKSLVPSGPPPELSGRAPSPQPSQACFHGKSNWDEAHSYRN